MFSEIRPIPAAQGIAGEGPFFSNDFILASQNVVGVGIMVVPNQDKFYRLLGWAELLSPQSLNPTRVSVSNREVIDGVITSLILPEFALNPTRISVRFNPSPQLGAYQLFGYRLLI